MSLSFLPTLKGGWASSVRVHWLGARCMTESSSNNLKDVVCTFALVGQWLFLSLTKSDTVARAPGCPQKTFVVKCGSEPLRQEGNTMFGPGEYRPDPSAGITAPADLPQPEIVPYSRNDLRQPCPRCGHQAYRDKQYQRRLHALGNLDLWCPRDLVVTYSQHYCTKCRKYF